MPTGFAGSDCWFVASLSSRQNPPCNQGLDLAKLYYIGDLGLVGKSLIFLDHDLVNSTDVFLVPVWRNRDVPCLVAVSHARILGEMAHDR